MEEEVGFEPTDALSVDGFRDRCFQPDSATLPHGAPGENRTHHELLCRQPLRQLASGAKWRGTRDSNPVMPGLESGALPIEPVPRDAGSGSRKHPILSQAAIPIRLIRKRCQRPDSNRHARRFELRGKPALVTLA